MKSIPTNFKIFFWVFLKHFWLSRKKSQQQIQIWSFSPYVYINYTNWWSSSSRCFSSSWAYVYLFIATHPLSSLNCLHHHYNFTERTERERETRIPYTVPDKCVVESIFIKPKKWLYEYILWVIFHMFSLDLLVCSCLRDFFLLICVNSTFCLCIG